MTHTMTIQELTVPPRELSWTEDDDQAVAVAMAAFAAARAAGKLPVAETGGQREMLTKFDPAAESITFLNPLVGG